MLSVLPFMAITRRCWFGCPLGFCPLCELLWGKWCPSFPSDPLSNEHLSSPIHPTTPAHKFSLSESLSPIPHCLLADWTDPFCILLQVTFATFSAVSCRSFLQLECASPLTCIHCSHCCSSTEWLCLCCTSAIGVNGWSTTLEDPSILRQHL